MPPLLFVSYRRTDSQQAAWGLFFQLRSRFGPKSVFMDRSGIAPGEAWPQRLKRSLEQATVVLVVMGPGWLVAADQYGRRRLDMAEDWVRNEVLHALEAEKPILPLLIAPLAGLPPREALPAELASLLEFQAYTLRDDHWEADINALVRLLIDTYGFRESDRPVRLPRPEVAPAPLTESELDILLAGLPGWERVESLIPGEYPKSRHELRKAYEFRSFRDAIEFLNQSVAPINELQHHPRWENQWRTVTVHLSTWDIGLRISHLDTDLAARLDAVYAAVTAKAKAKAAGP